MDFEHCLWRSGHQAIFARSQAISVCLGKDLVYTFTPEGRPFSIFRKGDFFQRGLSNQLLHKGRLRSEDPDQPKDPCRFRQLLPAAQAQALLTEVWSEMHSLQQQLPPGEAWQKLQTILAWSPQRLLADGVRFGEIYRPITILPPDQYLSLVLQLTEGCSYNRCSFCNFYKNRPFRIKSREAFTEHALAVKDFLGASLPLRKGVFLADGDALMTPQTRLLECLSGVREIFGPLPVFSFMDAFRPQAKSLAEWRELASQGLRRVYLGIETGDAGLLSWLDKPGSPALMLQEAKKLQAAGLSLGLILMVGAGGKEYANRHREASVSWLHQLDLQGDDFIYLSEFIPHPDQPYVQKATDAGITAFSEAELKAEIKLWRQDLADLPAKKVPYHLQEFVY